MKKATLLLLLSLALAACSGDDEGSYPNLITEMAMAQADAEGVLKQFRTDGGQTYQVSNKVTGMDANQLLRVLIGYSVGTDGRAGVYNATAVPLFSDATGKESPLHHPTGVASVWQAAGFMNLHLVPKTQGGKQRWAFLRDSLRTNAAGGQTHHLSVFHDQTDDPQAFSADFYACIALDSVAPAFTAADSVTLTIFSHTGPQTWKFGGLQ